MKGGMQAQQPLRLDGAQAAGVVDGAAGDDQQQQEEEAEQQKERDESELVTFPAVVRLQAVDGARHLEKALAVHTDHQLLERSDKRTHTLSSLLFRSRSQMQLTLHRYGNPLLSHLNHVHKHGFARPATGQRLGGKIGVYQQFHDSWKAEIDGLLAN